MHVSTETLYAINDALTALAERLGLRDSLGLTADQFDEAMQDGTMAVAAAWWPDESPSAAFEEDAKFLRKFGPDTGN